MSEPAPLRLIQMRTVHYHAEVNINVGKAELDGYLPDDVARWSARDLEFAIRAGLAAIQRITPTEAP